MSLFELGVCKLHSGVTSEWRINFEELGINSVKTLAYLISTRVQPFGIVEGVPTGGLLLADAMKDYVDTSSDVLLIVDDVITTGTSMERHRNGRNAIGFAVFDRRVGNPSPWIRTLWRLNWD